MLVMERIVHLWDPERLSFLLGDAPEVLADFVQQSIVDIDLEAQRAQISRHRLCRRLRIAVGEAALGWLGWRRRARQQ
jgi:hypothetical protein